MTRPALLAAALSGVVAVMPAHAQNDPTWTIDVMVAKGLVSQLERDTFVRDYMNACATQKAQAATLKLSADDLAGYCRCSAAKATSVITAGDIAAMKASAAQVSPELEAKLTAIGRDCAADFRERRAGQ